LTNFPFIHSDEAWLSGLSRNMLQNNDLSVTEPFFDLYPRHPHAIKTLFHLIQIAFIKLMGYNIFTFRFISLLAGTTALYIFYKLARKITDKKILSYLATIIMAVDIQFIYATHFARQEIILILYLLAAFYYFLCKYRFNISIRQDIILGLILGSSIGIHPNSFVIVLPFILIFIYHLLIDKQIKLINFLALIGTLGLFALFFILLSFKFNPNFIYNYTNYGESLGVFSSIFTKIDRLDYFYKKLYYQVSGTYYTPHIKFQFIIFALAMIYAITELIFKRNKNNIILLLIILGINVGYLTIGRYNQTSIIFIFPISYLLILNIISSMQKKYSYPIIALLITVLTFNTTSNILIDSHYNYDDYQKEIASIVAKNDRVLANLNTEYYFDNGKLFEYRNLAYLAENGLNFSDYIATNEIKYIIYPQEMDFIYNSRPVWNILYGNLFPYYQDMKTYLKNECRLVHNFTNKTYGMRIARYVGQKEWSIKIYQVIKD